MKYTKIEMNCDGQLGITLKEGASTLTQGPFGPCYENKWFTQKKCY